MIPGRVPAQKKNQHKVEDPPSHNAVQYRHRKKAAAPKSNVKKIDLAAIHKKNSSEAMEKGGSCVFEYGKGMSKRDNEGPGPRLLKQLLYVGAWAVHWMGEGRIKLWMSEYLV